MRSRKYEGVDKNGNVKYEGRNEGGRRENNHRDLVSNVVG
jgi:hypothetical protein